jgi:hypothetical protein
MVLGCVDKPGCWVQVPSCMYHGRQGLPTPNPSLTQRNEAVGDLAEGSEQLTELLLACAPWQVTCKTIQHTQA